MLLCVDVGNSNITIGVFDGDTLICNYRMNTKVRRTSDEYGFMLENFLRSANLDNSDIEGVIVSSVVPKVMHSFRNGIIKFLGIEPLVMGPGVKTGVSVQLENPRSVGADRIADVVGAVEEYGYPLLIVDFGTATTFDYVDENGVFKAGAIGVGIETGANALWGQTAQLPEIEIKKPRSVMGKNTQTAMQAGIFYQFLGGFEKTVEAFRKEAGVDFKVIATGGLGRVICQHTDKIDVYDPQLIFKGLKVVYERTMEYENSRNAKFRDKVEENSHCSSAS
ncbi:type III pantothenate kinase [Erysipelotrichaceae bacterium RD49]|nr:type III pantothenate kinase [Erysipelotrichaceae bacterium RD49]